ncbi:MAG: hypothetical protein AB1333_00460 [Patescibacteria group bacterium]
MLAKIIVKEKNPEEIKLFQRFLNHPDFPQHREIIIRAFPSLGVYIKKSKSEKRGIIFFRDEFYKKYKKKIRPIIGSTKKEVEKKQEKALVALGGAMDYQWKKRKKYIAFPTILPFSPFGKDKFFFSILNPLFGRHDFYHPLSTAIHEISHFIFFEKVRMIEKKKKIKLSKESEHYLKETLTAALFNEEPLKSTLGLGEYMGNPEIRDIFIKKEKKEELFLSFVRRKYRNKTNFDIFLTELVLQCHGSEKEFIKKKLLWDKYGKGIFERKKDFFLYKKSIHIM